MHTLISSLPLSSEAESTRSQTLDDLTPGESAIVDHLDGLDVRTRVRLLEMGLIPGIRIQVIRFAPLRDPIEIAIRGYRLSLRRHEASLIFVQKIAA